VRKFINSKKVKVLAGTILVDLIIFLVGPQWAESAIQIFSILGGTYIAGQSLADGISKGATSSIE